MYYIVELIKGGPVSERVMEIGQQIGLALLAMLMAFAFITTSTALFPAESMKRKYFRAFLRHCFRHLVLPSSRSW